MSDSARRPSVEAALDRMFPGEWSLVPEVPLDSFDLPGSLAQRVRFTPRGQGWEGMIEMFSLAMRRGDQFPAIIAAGRVEPGGLFIVDGMMVYQAAIRAGLQHLPTYVTTSGIHRLLAHVYFNMDPFPTEGHSLEGGLRQEGDDR